MINFLNIYLNPSFSFPLQQEIMSPLLTPKRGLYTMFVQLFARAVEITGWLNDHYSDTPMVLFLFL